MEWRPRDLSAKKSNIMAGQDTSNRILPVAGVHRSIAAGNGSGRTTTVERQYDEGPSNPHGRGSSENRTIKAAPLLRCRRELTLSTFNALTIREEARAQELAACAKAVGISILGIQEHRRVHAQSEVVYSMLEGMHLVTTSAWRDPVTNSAQGGVGLLLNSHARKAIRSVTPHGSRILVAEFQGNPLTSVIVVYSPHNSSNDEDMDNFYAQLSSAIQSIPAHHFLAVLGDFNARVGKENETFAYHEATNRNGQYLVDLAQQHRLIITNTAFRKRPGKQWTFRDRFTNEKRQLDYILVRKKWRNSVLNTEAYSCFDSVNSDHRLVSTKVRLSLRANKTTGRRVKHDWQTFSTNLDLQQRYTVEVRNRYQTLKREEETATETYQHFVDASIEALKLVPEVQKAKRTHQSDHPDVVRARKAVDTARSTYTRNDSEQHLEDLKAAKSYLLSVYNRLKEEELAEKISLVEGASESMKYGEAWNIVNNISGRGSTKAGQIEGTTADNRVKTWFTHFKNLLGNPPVVEEEDEEIPQIFSNLDIEEGPFTMHEFAKVKRSLRKGKSAGPDGIPPEIIKYCDLDDILLDICNVALMKNDKPEQWTWSNIIPVPKSGNLTKADNYRGISLTCIIAKLYNRMILNRIRPVINLRMRYNQNGFRIGRTTVAQILALRRIIEEVKKNNLSAILTFIDFKKAFDSIHRGKMMRILKAYGIPPRLLSAIETMYSGTKAKVVTPDGTTEEFDILAGVLQGDTLAPFLFVIVLDYALRKATANYEHLGFTITPRRSRRHGPVTLTDLDFADDICLLSDEIQEAQELLERVEKECSKVGLHLNAKKTEYMAFNIGEHQPLTTSDGSQLKRTGDFKYLGAWVNTTEQDIRIRKSLAWKALHGMKKIWKSTLSKRLKARFFIGAVETILLYGCEAWTLTRTLSKALDGCYTRMLRMVFNISWKDHVTNAELYGDLPRLTDKIAARRLSLAGHCFRHPELPAHHVILWQPKHGKMGVGRPPTTMVNTLLSDTSVITVEELATCMQDRDVWRRCCRARLSMPT